MGLLGFALLAAWLPYCVSAQSVDSRFDSNGVPIRYVMSGAGEPVILIHGFWATAEMWDPVRTQLSSHYLVIAMDCRGHGQSGKPHEPSAYGIEMANDVIRLLDHLHIQRAHVVGHSIGGIDCVEVASDPSGSPPVGRIGRELRVPAER
jgi:pimeloyl-ACP methyl ester carboxylesterase